jgi:hypothetical protein
MSPAIRKLSIVALAALMLAISASPASAGRRLTGNGSGNQWVVLWRTSSFASTSGLIDIWYTCRPRNNAARLRLILHRADGRERVFNPSCDRRGHWIQNIVVSPHSHDVRAEIYGGQAMGYTSVYEGH